MVKVLITIGVKTRVTRSVVLKHNTEGTTQSENDRWDTDESSRGWAPTPAPSSSFTLVEPLLASLANKHLGW